MDSFSDFGSKLSKYTFTRQIGAGGFGTVYEANDDLFKVYAIKIVYIDNDDIQLLVNNEINVLTYLKEKGCVKNILCLIEIIYNKNKKRIALVTQYVDGMDMVDFINENFSDLTTDVVKLIFQNIIKAIYYITQHGICHNDLKPENIMILSDYNVVIIDFGLSCLIRQELSKLYPISKCNTIMGGTPNYTSPEKQKNVVVDQVKSEVFSLGVIFYYTLTQNLPFKRNDNMLNDITKLKTEENYTGYPDELYQLTKDMMKYNYKDRPDLVTIYDKLHLNEVSVI